jgi:MFS family permease
LKGPAGEDEFRYEGWRVAAAAAVGVFVGFASLLVYTFGIFLKPLADEFSWSREAVSAAFGVAALTTAAASPLLGHLLDRVNPRRIIVPAIVIFGGAFASLSLLTAHLWRLYATFFVMGLVANGTAQMAYSRAVSTWFDRRRGAALALVMSGSAAGAIVLPPLAGRLIERSGWRTAALLLGSAVVAIGVPVALAFVRERPAPPAARRDQAGAAVRDALRSRVFWILVVVLFANSVAQNGALTHMAALLTDRGIAPGSAAIALSAMGVASLLGRLSTGVLLDRFAPTRVAMALFAIAAAGTLLLAEARTLAEGIAAAALIGAGMGAEADITPFLLSRYFGLRSFATLYGFTWTAYAAAGALGPLLMGRAFDLTGTYERLLLVLGTGMLAAAGLMLAIPTIVVAGFSRPDEVRVKADTTIP